MFTAHQSLNNRAFSSRSGWQPTRCSGFLVCMAKTKSTQQGRHPAKRLFPLFFGYLLENSLVRL